MLSNRATDFMTLIFGDPNSLSNTYFMYCLPPGYFVAGRYAYGLVNSWLPVFDDQWCGHVTAPMKMLGYNFNLNGAGEGTAIDGDQTGFMGALLPFDDLNMCYNAAQMFQLGWMTQVSDVASRPTSHTNYGGGLQAVRLQGTPAGKYTYIWFNHAFGMNSDTQEAKYQVIVTTRPPGIWHASTLMIAKLSTGHI